QAQRAGTKPVVLVDLDPDASLADWFALREEDDEPLPVARVDIKDLPTILQQLRAAGAALVVLDTPPTMHHAIDESIMAADLVAIPTRPCAHDLAAACATVEAIQSHGKPFVFVVNGVEPEGELMPEVVMALAQHGSIATVSIPRSAAMLETMVDGRTVMELPDSPAPTSEVARLWDYLAKRLMKSGMMGADGPASAPVLEIKTFETALAAKDADESERPRPKAAVEPPKAAAPKRETAAPAVAPRPAPVATPAATNGVTNPEAM